MTIEYVEEHMPKLLGNNISIKFNKTHQNINAHLAPVSKICYKIYQ